MQSSDCEHGSTEEDVAQFESRPSGIGSAQGHVIGMFLAFILSAPAESRPISI